MIHREFEKYDNVILSDENIWHSSNGRKFPFWAKLMQDAKEHDYQVKVIVYIRRQDGLANSWLSQQVKEGWNTNATIKWDSFQRKTRKVVFHGKIYFLLSGSPFCGKIVSDFSYGKVQTGKSHRYFRQKKEGGKR